LQHSYKTRFGVQYDNKYFKKYECTEGRQKVVEIDKDEFNLWKKEAHALWGYIDFWGNFVPGILRTELPLIEINQNPKQLML